MNKVKFVKMVLCKYYILIIFIYVRVRVRTTEMEGVGGEGNFNEMRVLKVTIFREIVEDRNFSLRFWMIMLMMILSRRKMRPGSATLLWAIVFSVSEGPACLKL